MSPDLSRTIDRIIQLIDDEQQDVPLIFELKRIMKDVRRSDKQKCVLVMTARQLGGWRQVTSGRGCRVELPKLN